MAAHSPSKCHVRLLVFLSAVAVMSACSGAKKKTAPELASLSGKKVALVEVAGEKTAVSVVEVALVNQLVMRGTFELVSKQAVEAARQDPTVNSADAGAVARMAGADFALQCNVTRFSADLNQGYSSEDVEDSQLNAERGDGKTRRLYKVKSLDGKFEAELTFTDLATGETRTGMARCQDRAIADEKTTSARLPARLSFLERLANEAFKRFFDEYN